MKLWDRAYTSIFKEADSFKKSNSFKDARGAMLAVKQVIFRYIQLICPPPYYTPYSVKRMQALSYYLVRSIVARLYVLPKSVEELDELSPYGLSLVPQV